MNNDKKYWMKRRRYGWGWTPTTWQGWLFVLSQTIILLIAATQLPAKPLQPSTAQLLKLLGTLVFVLVSLLVVGMSTGPKPHWRWGKKDSDNLEEDI